MAEKMQMAAALLVCLALFGIVFVVLQPKGES